MDTINPATQERIGHYEVHSPDKVQELVARAGLAADQWKRTSFADRRESMKRAAGVLRARRGELAELMTREMGKPITASEGEVDKCAACCDWFAEHAESLLRPEDAPSDATRSYVRFDPIGPVLAIMPWNFPLWQVFRFAAPGLMAGNVGLLKHASNVPGCALAIERVFAEAHFPAGVFTTLLISGKAAEDLIAHPAIRAVTLTGSEEAGKAVAAAAGKALKKTVLELGGSDPFIVLADVDIEATAQAAAAARCINAGQSCIAAKRFIVVQSIAERFEQAMAGAMAAMKVGDPMDRATQVGPLAREDLLAALQDQVDRTISAGAKLLCGGARLPRRGYFYPPTVLTGVRPGMAAFDEETFGPVAAIVRAKDAAEAVRLGNLSRFGLGASIWTRDIALAERLAGEIDSGCVFVNGAVKSDPRLPFGGVKSSGYGRELAAFGIREFVNIKTVWVRSL